MRIFAALKDRLTLAWAERGRFQLRSRGNLDLRTGQPGRDKASKAIHKAGQRLAGSGSRSGVAVATWDSRRQRLLWALEFMVNRAFAGGGTLIVAGNLLVCHP